MSKISTFKCFQDDRGVLLPIETEQCPFKPERIFIVHSVPRFMRRGCHAHIKTRQFIICVTGSILIGLHDGETLQESIIKPGEAILVDEMIWDYQDFLTGHDTIVVLCSTSYDPSDYILDFDEYLRRKQC